MAPQLSILSSPRAWQQAWRAGVTYCNVLTAGSGDDINSGSAQRLIPHIQRKHVRLISQNEQGNISPLATMQMHVVI